MNKNKIHTFNARDNIIMSLANKINSGINMNKEINGYSDILIENLKSKGIDYSKLSRALIPSRDENKYEYAFVFYSRYFDDKVMFYGEEIINKVLSIINKDSTQSILIGDYVKMRGIENEEGLKENFIEKIEYVNKVEYKHCMDYFFVYINNITKKQVEDMARKLKDEKYFVGAMNLKYTAKIKLYLSCILVPMCIKYKNKVIVPSSACDENYCEQDYKYKENGFDVITVDQMLYNLFLAYKIPNGIRDEEDLKFSYDILVWKAPEYDKIKVVIDEKKLNYLKSIKKDSMDALGISNISKEKLEKKIRINLYNNYIYNVEENEFGDLKFNVLIEFNVDGKPKNALIALKYLPDENELRLITMY